MALDLILKEIQDDYVRENFTRIRRFLEGKTFLKGTFKFFELEVTAAVTNQRHKHNLGFVPKDVIITSQIGAGALTINYSRFDIDFIDFTTTGAVAFRGFVGTYREGT